VTHTRGGDRSDDAGGREDAGDAEGSELVESLKALVDRFDSAVEAVVAPSRRHPVLDRVMYALSEAGNHSIVWHSINLVQAGTTRDPVTRRAALRRSAIQVGEQALVNGPIKMVFRRSRPDHVNDHPHDLRVPVTSSFPSGHASAGFCAAMLLSADNHHDEVWFGLASAISWSRVHVGVHHPSDIVGGAAIGLVLASVAARLWPTPAR
jgi:undecaprenyl-diphosphatase